MEHSRLSVLISTYRPEGIAKVAAMNLPVAEGVDYVVSWQEHDDRPVPESLASRTDITIWRTSLSGLCNNRNNALDHAGGEIVLIADDDVTYTAERLQRVIEVFDSNPDADLISFMFEGSSKKYPRHMADLATPPTGFYLSSIEIAFRNSERTRCLRFNNTFGLGGTRFNSGEEEMLLLRARRHGLKCLFYPAVIARHEGISTGEASTATPKFLQSKGAVIAMCHPLTFPLRIMVNAWRESRRGRAPFFKAAANQLRGALYALRSKEIREYVKPTAQNSTSHEP